VGEELEPGDGVEGVDRLELEPQVQVPHFDAAVLAPRHHALLHIPRRFLRTVFWIGYILVRIRILLLSSVTFKMQQKMFFSYVFLLITFEGTFTSLLRD
jgi:hypothetical protein